MIIDSHLHVLGDDVERFPFARGMEPAQKASVEFLNDTMAEAGVDKAVIVQPRNYVFDNSYLADCLKRFPGRFAAMGLVDPKSPDGADRLEELVRERGFSGLRLELGWETDLNDFYGADRMPLWQRAEELGACFGILGSNMDHSCLAPMVARFPGVNVVLDHLGGVPLDPELQPPLLDAVLRLARYPNVYVKVSNLQGKSREEYPYRDTYDLVRRIYDAYGPQRLMWGTDFPGVMRRCGYSRAVDLVRRHIGFLTEDDKEWLFNRTATQVWRFGRD